MNFLLGNIRDKIQTSQLEKDQAADEEAERGELEEPGNKELEEEAAMKEGDAQAQKPQKDDPTIFTYHGKREKFSRRSLWLFTKNHKVRRCTVWTYQHKLFD